MLFLLLLTSITFLNHSELVFDQMMTNELQMFSVTLPLMLIKVYSGTEVSNNVDVLVGRRDELNVV